MNDVQRQIYFQAHMLDECFVNESMFDNKKYDSLKELQFYMDLYPTYKEEIIQKAGKEFKLNGKNAWFIVVEDGNCIAFDEKCNEVKIDIIKEEMISEDIKKIIIPDSVESIGKGAFKYCKSLKSITITDSVKSIKDFAFRYCTSLESIVIQNSVESIGNWAFAECSSLESIIIPDSVKRIGECAFCYCESLKSITIPNLVTSIENYAFYDCVSLETIIISSSVESIGYGAFWRCLSLKEVVFKDKTLVQVQAMKYYPWDIDESIIRCEV